MRKIISILLFLLLIAQTESVFSQISQGGLPPSFLDESIVEEYDEVSLRAPNLENIFSDDIEDEKNGTFRKNATLIPVDLDMNNSGVWTDLPSGGRIWRLKIKSEGALALGVYYNGFYIPAKAKLFLYNKTKRQVIGAFTEFNNPESGFFANELIDGDEVTLEYFEPAGTIGVAEISIEAIAWAYRDVVFSYEKSIDGFGDSDFCQVNVNCSPEGDNWQDQKRGVVRIFIVAGSQAGWCSGSIINNAKQDCTPYLLTADHCGDGSSTSNFNQYVFYFNYEASGCNNPINAPSTGTVTGCAKKASAVASVASDFLLLELNSLIPTSYNAYFNGWDRRNITSPSGVSIHHPAGDIKKISTYTNNLTSASWGATSYTHWRVYWSSTANGHGVTEGGSSGSPIFNADGRIVGDLTGGGSYCNQTGSPDLYGKVSYSWDSYGSTSSSHLKEWLDPDNIGLEALNGKNNVCGDNPPIADFSGTDTIVPFGETIDFIDFSQNFPHHWKWYFEGASIDSSFQQNPFSVQYDSIGDFDVTFIVWNDFGYDTLVIEDYITVVPVPADLDIIGNSISPNVLPEGYSTSLTSTVKNLGQNISPENYLKFYLSDDITYSTGDLLLDSVLVDSLDHFDQVAVSKDVIIPVGTPLGVNYIIYYVDADNIVYESNENNNTAFKAVVVVADLPDLEVNSVSIDSVEIHAGEYTNVSCNVSSDGYQDSPAGELKVFLSPDQQYNSSSDIYLSTQSFSALTTGSDENLNFDITIPVNSQQGDMYVLFIADADLLIEEGDETNNVGYHSVKVMGPLGINDINSDISFMIIPNPNSGEFIISIDIAEYQNAEISITDILGKNVYYQNTNIDNLNISLKGISKGIYFLKLSGEKKSVTRKFVIE